MQPLRIVPAVDASAHAARAVGSPARQPPTPPAAPGPASRTVDAWPRPAIGKRPASAPPTSSSPVAPAIGCQTPPSPPLTDHFSRLPGELRRCVAQALAPGSGDCVRLAATQRQLARELRMPALADSLVARLRALPHGDGQAIAALLDQANALPDEWRASVLLAALDAVGDAAQPEHDFGPLLQRLRADINRLRPASLRIATLSALLKTLAGERMAAIARTPQVSLFFCQLGCDSADWPGGVEGAVMHAAWAAGLYLMQPEDGRLRCCHQLIEQHALLPAPLSAQMHAALALAVTRMPASRARRTAARMLLLRLQALAPAASLQLIQTLVTEATTLPHPAQRTVAATVLLGDADALPMPFAAIGWAWVARMLPGLEGQPGQPSALQQTVLDGVLARLARCPVNAGTGCVAASLTETIGCQGAPAADARLWDDLAAQAMRLGAPDRAIILTLLAGALARLPTAAASPRFQVVLAQLHGLAPALRCKPSARLAQQVVVLPVPERAAAMAQLLWLGQVVQAVQPAAPARTWQAARPAQTGQAERAVQTVQAASAASAAQAPQAPQAVQTAQEMQAVQATADEQTALLHALVAALPTLPGPHEPALTLRMILAQSQSLPPAGREAVLAAAAQALPALTIAGHLCQCAPLLLADSRSLDPDAAGRLEAQFWNQLIRAVSWVAAMIDAEPEDPEFVRCSAEQLADVIGVAVTGPAWAQPHVRRALLETLMRAFSVRHPAAAAMRETYMHAPWQYM